MKQRVLIALLTAAVFAAGFAARSWTESRRPLPPPPAKLMSEFSPVPKLPGANAKNADQRPLNRAKLVAEIERLRPQIEAFRARMDRIDAEFDRDLAALLRPEQRERYAAQQKKWAERVAKGAAATAADPAPLSDEQIGRLQQRSLFNVLVMVAPTMKLEWIKRDVKLDESQQAPVRDLLQVRREKFLALIDSTPPPSITLSQLAPVVQKLSAPKKPPR